MLQVILSNLESKSIFLVFLIPAGSRFHLTCPAQSSHKSTAVDYC